MVEILPIVLNKKLGQTDGVYVGRPTVWGNPYEIGRDGTRTEVIDKYRLWMESNIGLVNKAKQELKGRNLICWCAPLPCHADVLLKIANETI
jgi:hypothetical protein